MTVSPSSRRRGRPSTDARERLCRAACELFAEKGYAATSVREIVARAKVTKPVLYYYFRNKEGIFAGMLEEAFRCYTETVNAALALPGTTRERIARFCFANYDLVTEHADFIRVIHAVLYGPPQGAPAIDFSTIHKHHVAALERLVREGIAEGAFRPVPVELATHQYLAVMHYCLDSQICGVPNPPGRAGLAKLLDLVYDGLRPEAKSRGDKRCKHKR